MLNSFTNNIVAYFQKGNLRSLIVIMVLIGALNAESSGASTKDEGSGYFSFGLNLKPDNAPPDQPVVVQPVNNSSDLSTSPTLQVTVSDLNSADKLNVNFYGRTKGTGSGADFSLVLIPDPQNEAQFYPEVFTSQANWIVAQQSARNIVFVTTAGDMVNNASSTGEYINADAAMDILDTAGIPYSVGAGNHDEPTTNFNTYFGISRFSGKSWYGGHYGTNNDNSYSLFTASGMDFILINLVYNPSTAVLDWADAVLKANSGRRAIVESHSILNVDNSWSNQSVYTSLKDNPNLFLLLCGHNSNSNDGAAYRSEAGDDGHTIHIMLADYQNYPNGGNGILRILRFSPAADKIYATTYSTYTGTYITTSPDQMELVYDMADGSGGPYTLIGTASQVDNGSNASVTWPDRLTSTAYEWYTTVSDGTAIVSGPTWSFITASTVSYNLMVNVTGNGSVSRLPNKSRYNQGEVVQLTANADAGWTFSGWSGDLTGSANPRSVTMNGNRTITATFTINSSCIPPAVPITDNISQPTCATATGSVTLSGLPAGTWTINPGSIAGNTSIKTISGLIAGTYNFTVTDALGCTSSATTNIVMNEQPVIPSQPGAITGNATVCQDVSQIYRIAAVTGAESYLWTLPSGWSGSSGSTSITATPGAIGGIISVTAYNSCGSGIPWTMNITVQATPAQPGPISGNNSVCQGVTQTYNIAAVTGATSYTWTLPSGWSGNSTSTSITAEIGVNSGNISIIANSSCGSGPERTLNVTVTPLPGQPGTISGASSVCPGTTQTYSVSAVSGSSSYIWTLPSGWNGSSNSTSITATTGTGSGTISVFENNSCGSGPLRTLSISVTAIPAQPGTISGNTTVCQGVSQTYSIASVTGATSYAWTLPSGWNGSSGSTSITVNPGANGGIISVSANNSCGTGTPRTLSVSVPAIPVQPGTITGNATVCQGVSQTYSISPVTGATSYTWTLPSGWSGSSGSESITAATGTTGGLLSVTANNSCGTGVPQTLNITVQAAPAQPGAVTGNITVCQGVTQTFSISEVSGSTSYTWILPSGWSGISNSTSITATIGANSGIISVTANNSCGSGPLRTLSVTVPEIPAQPGAISGNSTVCQGVSHTYSIAAVAGATTYTWMLPSGWSGSSNSTSITATIGSNSGTILVSANNSCGSGTLRTLGVTVPEIPAQPGALSGNTSVCQGVTQTFSISEVSGSTSYTWILPSGWSGSSTSASITAIVGASGGNISVTANNSCGTSTPADLDVTVNTIPAQPVPIAGNTAVCQGATQIYSVPAVSGATSYTWTLPTGWSGNSNSTSMSAKAGTISGNISVTANNACGSGTTRILGITVTALPGQPGTITGATLVCLGSSQTYSITPVSGATSYIWTLPSGWSGSSGSASITAIAGANSGTISVTAINSCGSGASRTSGISVEDIPAQPDAIAGNTTVCQGVSQTYSIATVTGATSYTWTLPSGWSGSSASPTISATVGTNGGTISVSANNFCGPGPQRTLDVELGSLPSVLTLHARGISSSIAEGAGDLISDGGLSILERGVCWSTTVNPTIADSKASDAVSMGLFTSLLNGLTSGVSYHIRAYATNCSGTGYGSDITYFHLPTDILEIQNDKILVFPNPVSGILNIEYYNDNFKAINIVNSSGVLIGKEKASTPWQQLDFSKFEYGIYILEFTSSSGDIISRVKVIKAK